MTSAFLAYLVFHEVFPDIPDLLVTANLAKRARRELQEAHRLETALSDPQGRNRVIWDRWGGSYGGPERGGQEKVSKTENGSGTQEDDGGWTVEPGAGTEPNMLFKILCRNHVCIHSNPITTELTSRSSPQYNRSPCPT